MGNKAGFDDDKLFDIAEVGLDKITTPTNPDSAHIKIYGKADNSIYKLDSNGVEIELADNKKVLVSSNDTTEDYFPEKLEAGPGITFTPLYDGSDEKLKVEVNNTVGTSRHSAICGKTGTAGSNTYLEFFRAISSHDSPWVIAEEGEIKSLAASFKTSSTVTFAIMVNSVQIDTLTITSDTTGSKAGLSHYVDVEDEISVKVLSGSAKDVVFFTSILVYI